MRIKTLNFKNSKLFKSKSRRLVILVIFMCLAVITGAFVITGNAKAIKDRSLDTNYVVYNKNGVTVTFKGVEQKHSDVVIETGISINGSKSVIMSVESIKIDGNSIEDFYTVSSNSSYNIKLAGINYDDIENSEIDLIVQIEIPEIFRDTVDIKIQ